MTSTPPSSAHEDELQEANERLVLAALQMQRMAEKAERNAAGLRGLLENLTEGVIVFDADGRVVIANELGRRMLGISAEKPTVEDLAARALCWPDGRLLDFEREIVGRLLEGERFSERELLLRLPDGKCRHLVFSGSSVRDDNGRVLLAVKTFRDVTELRTLAELRRQYVALVTHDLRGPLMAARLSAELLARGGSKGTQPEELAGRVVDSLTRIDDMVRRLLDSERRVTGAGLELDLAPTDLVSLSASVLADLSAMHGSRFILKGASSVVGLWSADELRRAIWNLVSNAVKYGADQSPVTVNIEQLSDTVALSVHNLGPRIPPEEQKLLFQPYFRTEDARRQGQKGWGLGLTQVQSCALAHGGSVSVQSDAVAGTTFALLLPLRTGSSPSRGDS